MRIPRITAPSAAAFRPASDESASAGSASVESASLRPMRAGLARMVAGLRGAMAAVAVVSALVGAVRPVSWAWLAPALALVTGWTSVYVLVAWKRGLRAWLVAADLVVAAGLSLAVGHLVPAAVLPRTTSWVCQIASMTIVSAQLGGAPAASVPGGLLVVASLVAGQRLAHSADGGIPVLTTLTTQVLVAAAVMVVAMRAERIAVRAFTGLQEARAAQTLALARREDERAQLRVVHNGPLTTLTMALHARDGVPSATLRRRAAATLDALPRLVADADAVTGAGEDTDTRLDERISQVVVWYEPPLRIAVGTHPCSVPAKVADAFTGAVAEALENAARYAGTDQAAIELRESGGTVQVTVLDHGRGFDPAAVRVAGFGVREDLTGRMAAVGGRAVVRSSPGSGTVVELAWRRG
jgi:signal transduction histidine kinase